MGFFGRALPLAAATLRVYREEARQQGWAPTPDNVIYRALCYVAETDDQADAETKRYKFGQWPKGVFPGVDVRTIDDRGHGMSHVFHDMLFWGSPERVVKQIQHVHRELGAGVVDLNFTSAFLP